MNMCMCTHAYYIFTQYTKNICTCHMFHLSTCHTDYTSQHMRSTCTPHIYNNTTSASVLDLEYEECCCKGCLYVEGNQHARVITWILDKLKKTKTNSSKSHIFVLVYYLRDCKVMYTVSCKTWKLLCKISFSIYRQEKKIHPWLVTCASSEWNVLDIQIAKPYLLHLFQCYFQFAFGNNMKLANREPWYSHSALTLLSSLAFHRDSFLRLHSRSLTLKARGSG